MNTQNIDRLIAAIAAEPERFDISSCSSCFMRFGEELFGFGETFEALGFHDDEDNTKYKELIMPANYAHEPDLYPASRAVAVLAHLRDTGEVDWSVV